MPTTSRTHSSLLALDVGERRIGVAIASIIARLPRPLTTLANDGKFADELSRLLADNDAATLVVGLPRGLDGQHTAQTQYVESFIEGLNLKPQAAVYWQDEALTSRKAEAELDKRGKPYAKGDIDSLSATYILEDFLRDHPAGDL